MPSIPHPPHHSQLTPGAARRHTEPQSAALAAPKGDWHQLPARGGAWRDQGKHQAQVSAGGRLVVGRAAVEAAGLHVSGRGEGDGRLGHQGALHGSAGGRGGGGARADVVWAGWAAGRLRMEDGLWLREGQSGHSVGGGGAGEGGGGDGEGGGGQVALRGLGALVVEQRGGGGESRQSAAVVAMQGRPSKEKSGRRQTRPGPGPGASSGPVSLRWSRQTVRNYITSE